MGIRVARHLRVKRANVAVGGLLEYMRFCSRIIGEFFEFEILL